MKMSLMPFASASAREAEPMQLQPPDAPVTGGHEDDDPILGSCPTCSSLVPYLGWRCTHKGPGFIGCPVCSGICSVDLVYPPA
jgi:hypothetical protein